MVEIDGFGEEEAPEAEPAGRDGAELVEAGVEAGGEGGDKPPKHACVLVEGLSRRLGVRCPAVWRGRPRRPGARRRGGCGVRGGS